MRMDGGELVSVGVPCVHLNTATQLVRVDHYLVFSVYADGADLNQLGRGAQHGLAMDSFQGEDRSELGQFLA